MSTLPFWRQVPKGSRLLGKIRKRPVVPFYTVYGKGEWIGCGHQHQTIQAAVNCATNKRDPMTVWEIVPGGERMLVKET